ncbi:uncharacterized protein BKA78DRAFT_349785 [Phyllosticta capitalensis]|uniref:uncharacterized protein n=1 Tax=Phyllosticta capitalensis TaxID=121624 RepID=UPI0031302760
MRKYYGEKLAGSGNFRTWKRKLENKLSAYGLLEHVKSNKGPLDLRDPSLDDTEDLNWIIDWGTMENRAKNMIRRSLSITAYEGEYSTTAHGLFNSIVEHYEKIPVNKYVLLQRWQGLQWDGTGLSKFLREWYTALANCIDGGIPIAEEVKVLTFVNMVCNCGNTTYETWARVKIAFNDEKELQELSEVTRELHSQWCSDRGRRLELEEDKDKCGVCSIKGHTPSSCWHLHPELGPRRFRPRKGLVRAFKERIGIEDEDDGKDPEDQKEHEAMLDEKEDRLRRQQYFQVLQDLKNTGRTHITNNVASMAISV